MPAAAEDRGCGRGQQNSAGRENGAKAPNLGTTEGHYGEARLIRRPNLTGFYLGEEKAAPFRED